MKTFREVLKDWMGEVDYMATSWCEDGTPRMGKHETEEVYRYAKKFLAEPDTQESVLLEKSQPEDFAWINKCCKVMGEEFSYTGVCLCSFPKSNGTVRFIVEDGGRLFIQRPAQINFIEDRPFNPPKHPPNCECGDCWQATESGGRG